MTNQTALRVLSEPENKARHQVNLAPAIKAYAVERMEQLKREMNLKTGFYSRDEIHARLSELQMLVAICEGLEQQGKVFSGMLDSVFGGSAA